MTESINETTVFWYSWFSLYGVNAHDIRKRGMIALYVSKNVSKSHFPSTERHDGKEISWLTLFGVMERYVDNQTRRN